ncbi:hypothetical protein EI94DRAFT_1832824 [Lactarius quietus]|nr:hypothetical protein EI94DRAFT_1832824 [Lactarius quietus]
MVAKMLSNPREYLRQAINAESKSLGGSIRGLRLRNVLAPISSLPPVVFTFIFTFLHVHVTSEAFVLGEDNPNRPDRRAWLRVAHVCHQWREIALNRPLFWRHVDFTIFTSAGAAEILARAKKAPLHLEARVPVGLWDDARFSAFQKELQDHVSQIGHLAISAEPCHINRTLKRLTLPAPTLESLSLLPREGYGNRMRWEHVFVPDNLFAGSTPRLSSIEVWECEISWRSPLFRYLQHLEIRIPHERPSLSVWLDALQEMPQLKTLALHWASPVAPDAPLPSDIDRTATLPSLTHFEISSPARDCGLALAHLVLPALTSLCLIPKPCHRDGRDVQELFPYVTRHAHGPQDTQPLQSMLFRKDNMCIEILAWTSPDMDVDLPDPSAFFDVMRSARVAFSLANNDWPYKNGQGIFDSVMGALPLDSLVTLTSQNCRTLNKQFWLRHAPGWPSLRHIRLSPDSLRGFRKMLLEDKGERESPLLPSLTKLTLINTALGARRTLRLCDALLKRVEQGVPLETLDLRTCLSARRPIELLSEIVVEVLGPKETFETGERMLYTSISRGIYLDDSSETEEYDEDDPDTGSGVRDNWEIDGEEYEYEEDYW